MINRAEVPPPETAQEKTSTLTPSSYKLLNNFLLAKSHMSMRGLETRAFWSVSNVIIPEPSGQTLQLFRLAIFIYTGN